MILLLVSSWELRRGEGDILVTPLRVSRISLCLSLGTAVSHCNAVTLRLQHLLQQLNLESSALGL